MDRFSVMTQRSTVWMFTAVLVWEDTEGKPAHRLFDGRSFGAAICLSLS